MFDFSKLDRGSRVVKHGSVAEPKTRRRPVQARAADRRETLLDAAATILAERGFEAVTTRAIAKTSGAAVGTVYDYFPDKVAVLEALLERYRQRLQAVLVAALADADSLEASVRAGVDAFYRFYRDEPGYQPLWLGSQLVDELRMHGERWGEAFAVWLGAVAPDAFTAVPSEQRIVVARLCVHLISAGITTALTGRPEHADATVEHTTLAVLAYLGAVAG